MAPEATPSVEHLSSLLGVGPVRAIVVESSRDTIFSRIQRLRVTYDGPTEGPATLILKTGHPNRANHVGGRHEVAFYRQVAPALPPGLVPRCFEAQWDEATEAWHILLEDLADTHVIASAWPLPPTTSQCGVIIDAWARFHAASWDDPRLGVSIGNRPDQAGIDQYMRDLTGRFQPFVDLMGDRLTRERRDRYERLLAEGPRLLRRQLRPNHRTIVHRDAHVWNCFLPRDGGEDVRLFDWDGWRIGLASSDLAYMMATHWYPERRHRLERPLLDRYHAALVTRGVQGYDRAALEEDYRWSALWQTTIPIWQASLDIPPVIWWSHFERTNLAFEDLDCADLLSI